MGKKNPKRRKSTRHPQPDVFESVRHYYEDQIDWTPNMRREWVEAYLCDLKQSGVSPERLEDAWDDVQSFIFYQNSS